ncbi:DUF4124 domain-containing protein [Kinneretia aquatilis]|uniref:DUF4124 domain-containing protein n=1 Tax=Kinneretia aquatilis TaxID=2070761 RepID=UPI001495164C|nr:DUF4124 domain-containing protein [Paucibacter aquatile]WIV97487.1 DUF4124 domain-containing protein [Paucibacter aquatile]
MNSYPSKCAFRGRVVKTIGTALNTTSSWSTAFALALAAALPAYAINKCTGADGRVLYQELPCAGGKEVDISHAGRANPAAISSAQVEIATASRRSAVAQAIARGEPLVGMTEAELTQAMGAPDRSNLGNYGGVQSHQLIYDRGVRTWYVYTRNGAVSSIQNTERIGAPERQRVAQPCPSPLAIRNMETSASSRSLREAEQVEMLRTIREIRSRCG